MSSAFLSHTFSENQQPKRVVILGSGGFVGSALMGALKDHGVDVLGLTHQELDLTATSAAQKLTQLINTSDTLVFISAKAPCKDLAMLIDNAKMASAVCEAIKAKPVAHLIYVSSDAVYGDSLEPMNEASPAAPTSIHGVMHLMREVALQQAYTGPLAIIRPTLIYGVADPHNGYGPNRFNRQASQGQLITLFGEGEERRDHVLINDVAKLIYQMILRRSVGVINAVSGEVVSFKQLAQFCAHAFEPVVTIKDSIRVGPMPHNGYRAFDASAIRKAFPQLQFKSWQEGLTEVHAQIKQGN